MKSKYYSLFSNCPVVLGYSRASVCDLQKQKHWELPRNLGVFLKDNVCFEKSVFMAEFVEYANDYLLFLLNNKLLLESEDNLHEYFPPFPLQWDASSQIVSCIIEIDSNKYNIQDIKNMLHQLSEVGVCFLQIFIYNLVSIDFLEILIALTDNLWIKNIEVVAPFCVELSNDCLETISKNNNRVFNFILYNAPCDAMYSNTILQITHLRQDLSQPSHCGFIDRSYIFCNIELFSESQKFNTCLNRKISIDMNGYIKNCPKMNVAYGHIQDVNLSSIIHQDIFQNLWDIKKDDIDICKDCEFRYMCTDCRCFIKDPDNIYSQPAKCTYNPYIAKWQDEEGYVPVEECGLYTKETGFVPDKNKIELLNQHIWGEK